MILAGQLYQIHVVNWGHWRWVSISKMSHMSHLYVQYLMLLGLSLDPHGVSSSRVSSHGFDFSHTTQ